VHIYAFALAWVAGIIFLDVSPTLGWIAVLLLISLVVCGVVRLICSAKSHDDEYADILNSEFMNSNNPDTQVVLETIAQFKELQTLRDGIENTRITNDADYVIKTSRDILRKATVQPNAMLSIKPFLGYYLPTTKKMLENYSFMEKQQVKGSNIIASMEKIENTLTLLKDAFAEQLDSLFSDTHLDLDADIAVLEDIIKQDRLSR